MPDNYTTNEGAGGSTFASDDIGGTHYPRVKLSFGDDGTANDVGPSNKLPITDLSTTKDAVVASLSTATLSNGSTSLTPKFAFIDAALSPDNTIIAAVGGKKIRVLSYSFIAAGAVTARFESDTGGNSLTGQMQIGANGKASAEFNPLGHFETVAGELLNLELSGAVSVDGHLTYVEV